MRGVEGQTSAAVCGPSLALRLWERLRRDWRPLSWWPTRHPVVLQQYAFHGRPLPLVLVVSALMCIAAHPVPARATGVGPRDLFVIWVLFTSWIAASTLLYRRALRSDVAFHVLVLGNMTMGAVVCLAFPVLSASPQSAYWATFPVAACCAGAAEGEASILPGLLHIAAPFATIPFFLAKNCGLMPAVAPALVTAAAAGFGYFVLARRGHLWRVERVKRELAQAHLRLEASERERKRLSRDLHDSVGTALSLVSLYGSLVEEKVTDAGEARRLAGTIRESARQALDELRGVLHALPQSPAALDELAEGLLLVGRRSARALGAELDVHVVEGAAVRVEGPLRSTIVRIFHEALHNALRHGGARRIEVALRATQRSLAIEIRDDGTGHLPTDAGAGAGLSNIRARAEELGGTAEIHGREGCGTRVHVSVPLRTAP